MELKEQLTEDDKSMIAYFITEKGDVTRWTGWERAMPLVEKELPHLMDALRRLESAKRTLDALRRLESAKRTLDAIVKAL